MSRKVRIRDPGSVITLLRRRTPVEQPQTYTTDLNYIREVLESLVADPEVMAVADCLCTTEVNPAGDICPVDGQICYVRAILKGGVSPAQLPIRALIPAQRSA